MTAGEVIATLILKCGISPGYVLDDMPLYLVDLLLEHAYIIDRAAAERMRMVCWMTAQVNSDKQLRPEDIIKFSWEEEDAAPEPMTDKKLSELRKQAQAFKELLENGKQ